MLKKRTEALSAVLLALQVSSGGTGGLLSPAQEMRLPTAPQVCGGDTIDGSAQTIHQGGAYRYVHGLVAMATYIVARVSCMPTSHPTG